MIVTYIHLPKRLLRMNMQDSTGRAKKRREERTKIGRDKRSAKHSRYGNLACGASLPGVINEEVFR